MLKKLGLSVLLLIAQNGAEAAVRDFTLHIDNGTWTITDIGGREGKNTSAPAMTLAAAKGKKAAFRLIGMHSVNSTFQIKDSAGNAKPFTVYIRDGRALPVPKVLTCLDISPGQRADLIVSLPTTTGTWYPQVTYKTLRNNSPYATVYGKVTF
jgi:FtsP/CotA-like multicopper oxidase with cupredoxin domain